MALIYESNQAPVSELNSDALNSIERLLGISPSGTAVELAVSAILNYVPTEVIREAVDDILEEALRDALANRFIDNYQTTQAGDQREHEDTWTINAIRNYIESAGGIGDTGPQGPQGPQGADGYIGQDGPTGPQGAQGNPGTGINILPSQSQCSQQGDAYVDEDGMIYILMPNQQGILVFSSYPFRGPTGPQGVQGVQGIEGAAGFQGFQGAQGPQGEAGTGVEVKPDEASCSQIGDSYIDNDGNLMILTSLEPRRFTNGGQIKGPQGNPGTGILRTDFDSNGRLYIYYTNGGGDGPFDVKGDRGATGVQGRPGDTGPTGPKGDTGAASTVPGPAITMQIGNVGSTGPSGTPGANVRNIGGNAYALDLTLKQGPTGPPGPAGQTGAKGPTGSQGSQGNTGSRGQTGSRGETGAQGQTGSQGSQGRTGSQGNKGETGSQGVTGSQGSQGRTGSQGVAGPQGGGYWFKSSSNIYAGSSTTPAYAAYATAFYQSSDERLKTIYGEYSIDKALAIIENVPAINYILNSGGNIQLGVSAQKLQEVAPELVRKDDNGYLSVAYDRLSVVCMTVLKYILSRIN